MTNPPIHLAPDDNHGRSRYPSTRGRFCKLKKNLNPYNVILETPVVTETKRHGEAAIEAAELEAVPNPAHQRTYTVELSYPEFTCKCPRTGYPDFATINLTYVPDDFIVELKSWKLYLNRYRDEYVFHEAVTNQILDDFVAAIRPARAEIVADWNVRGNLKTVVRAEYLAEQGGQL